MLFIPIIIYIFLYIFKSFINEVVYPMPEEQ